MGQPLHRDSDGPRYQRTGEDTELTDFLNQKIAQIFSLDHEPMPSSCPRCNGTKIRRAGHHRRVRQRFAKFLCDQCKHSFTRLFGTPFLGHLYNTNLDVFVSLLSQPLSLTEAAERMGGNAVEVRKRVLAMRRWLLEVDPSGQWERRISLGGLIGELHTKDMRFAEAGAREDAFLTDRLTQAFDAMNSLAVHPYPPCAYCGSSEVSYTPNRASAFPRYRCSVCSKNFSRRTGTVFAKSKGKNLGSTRAVIRYLSLPLSFVQVSDELKVYEPSTIEHWRNCFSVLADQLEPNGSLSSRIRLGVEPTDTTPCPYCGRTGTAVQRRSAWGCSGCGRLFSMRRRVIERDGLLQIADENGEQPNEPVAARGSVMQTVHAGAASAVGS